MNGIKRKLSSRSGASITFALLLFLVCAVISSVVIVAATAVGGRASKMAEMDQRYYAVNSAAELLRDVLEEQTVTVTTGTRTVSTVDQDGKPVEGTETSVVIDPEVLLNGEPVEDEDKGTLIIAAAGKLVDPEGTHIIPDTLSLAAEDEGYAALSVTMSPRMSDEKLFVDIFNTDNAKGVYSLRLTFKANATKNSSDRTTYGTPVPTKGDDGKVLEGQYKKQKTVERRTVTTIGWKLIDLQTVVAATA